MGAVDVLGTLQEDPTASVERPVRLAKVIDQTRCIGCHACTTACKSENDVPVGVTRTVVKAVEVGSFPQVRRAFQVTRCNQCDDAPCVAACPTAAMFRRPDGIVDFDKRVCIGCKACMAACPYDAIFINPDDHSAEKCNVCAHRLEIGLEPACVVVCPVEAILVGDLDDPDSKVARLVARDAVTVRRPEKETRPKLFYRGAHQATLDPLAARRPDGGLFMWSEQGASGRRAWPHGAGRMNSSAAALLAYDVPRAVPWDWRVGLYTWTKGIAAGAYLAPLALALAGLLPWSSSLWRIAAPAVALAFLALTGLVLIWDLEHPRRFAYLFLRPQWRSWLVRGAVVITAYALVLAAHLLLSAGGVTEAQKWLAVVGLPAAVATCRLHGVSVRPGEGARSLAEPAPRAPLPRPGAAGRGRRLAPARRLARVRRRFAARVAPRGRRAHTRRDGARRGDTDPPDRSCRARGADAHPRSLRRASSGRESRSRWSRCSRR